MGPETAGVMPMQIRKTAMLQLIDYCWKEKGLR